MAGCLLRSRAGKKRPVEHAELRVPGGIRNGDGEEAGIFVIHVADVDALIQPKGREPQRCQWKRSLDDARAMRGPWMENAVYVMM